MPDTISTIFYSWQSDCPNRENRSFIERALEIAIAEVNQDAEMVEAQRELEIDRDTKGLSGSPPIAESIFAKIDQTKLFVADLTFVGVSVDKKRNRLFPNPNVLIEYGYAVKALTYGKVVAVMNTAYGEPNADTLPFDLRHLRRPITYRIDGSESNEERKEIRRELKAKLAEALRPVLVENSNDDAKVQSLFKTIPEFDAESEIFNQPHLLISDDSYGAHEVSDKTVIPNDGRIFLRMHPKFEISHFETPLDAKTAASEAMVMPFADATGWDYGRNEFGSIAYKKPHENRVTSFTLIGLNKEIVGLDASVISRRRGESFIGKETKGYIPTTYFEDRLGECLQSFLKFYQQQGVTCPLLLTLELHGVRGYSVYVTSNQGRGPIVQEKVCWSGEIQTSSDSVAEILKPFLEVIWKSAGMVRPESKHEAMKARFKSNSLIG